MSWCALHSCCTTCNHDLLGAVLRTDVPARLGIICTNPTVMLHPSAAPVRTCARCHRLANCGCSAAAHCASTNLQAAALLMCGHLACCKSIGGGNAQVVPLTKLRLNMLAYFG